MEAAHQRANIIRNWSGNPALREQTIAKCSQDIVCTFDWLFWTFDARLPIKDRSCEFFLYDFQVTTVREIHEAITEGYDLPIDKSRDMGATWMILGVFVYNWLFTEGFHALVGSWKEELVDRAGDMNTQFERMRYILRQMDRATPGIVPAGWEKKSAHRKLINPSNSAAITGESTTENFSRQGRYNVILMDEFARIESKVQEELWTGTSDASPCRIINSTPMGMDNKFAEIMIPLKEDGRVIHPLTGKKPDKHGTLGLSLHWCLHPNKCANTYCFDNKGEKLSLTQTEAYALFMSGTKIHSPWYDREVKRRSRDEDSSPRAVAQELDIDYTASGSLVFAPEDLKAGLAKSSKPLRVIEAMYDRWPEKIIRDNATSSIYMFEKPDPKKRYAVFADAAQALDDQSDFNAFAVMDCIDFKIVCTGMGRWQIHQFSRVLCIIGGVYNQALLAVEANDVGSAVLAIITGRIGFASREEYDQLIESGSMMYDRLYVDWARGAEQLRRTHTLGWRTSRASKRSMISGLDKLISQRQIDIPDARFWQQAMHFLNLPGGKMGARMGHDDLVMATAGVAAIAPEARQFEPIPQGERKTMADVFRKMLDTGDQSIWRKTISRHLKMKREA